MTPSATRWGSTPVMATQSLKSRLQLCVTRSRQPLEVKLCGPNLRSIRNERQQLAARWRSPSSNRTGYQDEREENEISGSGKHNFLTLFLPRC